jgi:ParB-like chromosome segregation protein Spo0J
MSEIILGATIHPLAAMFPLLEGEEFEQLVESIDKHGIQTPILLLHHPPGHPYHKKGQPFVVVDGRNRLRAWERLANQGKVDRDYWINYVTPLSYDGDPNDEAYIRQRILAANIHRRHLTPDQRAAIMLRLTGQQIRKQTAEVKKASTAKARAAKSVRPNPDEQKKRDAKKENANSAAGQLAAAAKVGRHTAANAIAVSKAEESGKLPPGTMKAVEDGATTLAKAKKKAKASSVDTSGPRELKSPKSAGYALQTVRALGRYLESLTLDQERVNEELSRIKEYRHWEVLGFANEKELFASHGIDAEKLERYSTAIESLSLTQHVEQLADYLAPFVRSLKDISGDQWQEADRSSRRRLLVEIDTLAAMLRNADKE